MNQFFQRVASYITNEVIIHGLANSRTFQKIAVTTDASINRIKQTGTQTIQKAIDQYVTNTNTNTTTTKTSAGPGNNIRNTVLNGNTTTTGSSRQSSTKSATSSTNTMKQQSTQTQQQHQQNQTLRPPQPPLRGFRGFVSAFFGEIRKDLGFGK
jgi:hypothetical protein